MRDPGALLGSILQGTYKVERLIGEGGMGSVYEVSHLRVRRRFAVKVIAPSFARDAEALARFRREAEITSELGHPNIIEVVDFNTTPDGAPYLVMELLQGEPLDSRLARERKLPLLRVASILEEAASALDAAHGRGVIHRDLKPGNIFLQKGPRGDTVKLLDFGISKVLGSQSVVTGAFTLLGTPNYMSPEQAQGLNQEVDARTDVFAMGAILYEALAGQPAFQGEALPAILYQVVHQDPAPLAQRRPDLPAEAAVAVMRALRKRPGDRQEGIAELAREFMVAISNPVSAPLVVTERQSLSTEAVTRRETPVTEPTPGRAPGTTISSASGELQVERRAMVSRPRLPILALVGALLVLAAVGAYFGLARKENPVVATGTGGGSTAGPATRGAEAAPDAAPPAARSDLSRPVDRASAPPEPARPPRPRYGSLIVQVRQGADAVPAVVYLDGKRVDEAPIVVKQIAAGSHLLEVRLEGLRPIKKTIEIVAGKRLKEVIRLQ